MGRANIYLSDELDRRVRAAKLPISEICQQALLTAVEAAEAGPAPLGAGAGDCFAAGWTAGGAWVAEAPATELLRLARDLTLPEIPKELLPATWFSWNDEQTLAWEAGFLEAARSAVRAALAADLSTPTLPARTTPAVPAGSATTRAEGGRASDGPDADIAATGDATAAGDAAAGDAAAREHRAGSVPDSPVELLKPAGEGGSTRLGDSSRSYVGVDRDGSRVAFDPHTALEADKSPLFAVLGPADQRARLTLSIGQDAAARGAAVVVVDLSGVMASRATGLGRNVRVLRGSGASLPPIEELMRGGGNLRGVWEAVAGLAAGSGGLFPGGMFPGTGGPSFGGEDLVKPGYVTVVTTSGDGAMSSVLSAAHALRTLASLTSVTDHPRLLQVDLPTGVTVPAAVASFLTRQIRTARDHDVAFGLSAESAETVTSVGGSGALLSTVFGFATTSPVEADRLRDLLGASAPVLLNPPGTSPRLGDETWCVMRDLAGRLGQVRIDTL